MRNGKRIKRSNGRRLVDELIRTSNKMPMAAYVRDLDISTVATLRKKVRPKISWNVLFMKAYSIVAQNRPELRQCYVGMPWPWTYQHNHNVCLLTMSREVHGEERLLFARFNRPEKKSLLELQQQYDHYRKDPIEEIKQFKHQIRFANLPWFVRRFAWWMLLNWLPNKRMSHFGTFGMTLSGYKDAYTTRVLGPNTTILGIDVMPRNGVSKFSVTFDHQILDGVPVITAMDETYKALNGEIATELEELAQSQRNHRSIAA